MSAPAPLQLLAGGFSLALQIPNLEVASLNQMHNCEFEFVIKVSMNKKVRLVGLCGSSTKMDLLGSRQSD